MQQTRVVFERPKNANPNLQVIKNSSYSWRGWQTYVEQVIR